MPPSPVAQASLLKNSREARVMESSSHGLNGGAFQPPVPCPASKVTLAWYGGSLVNVSRRQATAAPGSAVGGRRRDSLAPGHGAQDVAGLLQGRESGGADDL